MDLAHEMNYFYARASVGELQALHGASSFPGLSYHSILYLNIIQMMEGCTSGKLAKVLGITPAAATQKVGELVKQGAVVKRRSEMDRRVYHLALSPQAKQAFQEFDRCFRRIQQELETKYPPAQLQLFGQILHDISNSDWSFDTPWTPPSTGPSPWAP